MNRGRVRLDGATARRRRHDHGHVTYWGFGMRERNLDCVGTDFP